MTKERRLGRGLAALLGEENEPVSISQTMGQQPVILRIHRPEEDGMDEAAPSEEPAINNDNRPVISEAATAKDGDLLLLAVDQIDENPFQPRREFSESELASLAESLKEHDLLQPVLVRRQGTRWQLISGERRLRAAVMAGWKQIPARVRQADDRLVAELAIVENLQRKDLNAIEKALSFRRYLEQHRCTQDDLGRRLKIDRSTIANLMRLLELPDVVQKAIQEGRITQGHAKAMLPLGDNQLQIEFCRQVEQDGLSVREVERLVQEKIEELDGAADPLQPPAANPNKARRKSGRPAHFASLEQQLRISLGTKVDIRQNARGRGQIAIQFRTNDEFERLFELLQRNVSEGRSRFAA